MSKIRILPFLVLFLGRFSYLVSRLSYHVLSHADPGHVYHVYGRGHGCVRQKGQRTWLAGDRFSSYSVGSVRFRLSV